MGRCSTQAARSGSAGNPPPVDRLRLSAIQFVSVALAAENVQYALNLKGWRGRKALAEAERVLDAVGLGDRKTFSPASFPAASANESRWHGRIAGPAPLILADEPTGNLDSESGNRVLSLFRDLTRSENRALLIVTHDPLVHSIADRIVTIRDGSVGPSRGVNECHFRCSSAEYVLPSAGLVLAIAITWQSVQTITNQADAGPVRLQSIAPDGRSRESRPRGGWSPIPAPE